MQRFKVKVEIEVLAEQMSAEEARDRVMAVCCATLASRPTALPALRFLGATVREVPMVEGTS